MKSKENTYSHSSQTWILHLLTYEGEQLPAECTITFETLDQLRLYAAAAEQLGFTTELRGYGRIKNTEHITPKHA
jgi:hypothetical protein